MRLTKKEILEILWSSSICIVLVVCTLTFAYWVMATMTGIGFCV